MQTNSLGILVGKHNVIQNWNLQDWIIPLILKATENSWSKVNLKQKK